MVLTCRPIFSPVVVVFLLLMHSDSWWAMVKLITVVSIFYISFDVGISFVIGVAIGVVNNLFVDLGTDPGQ